MTHEIPGAENAALQRQRALAKWDNEGGAGSGGPQLDATSVDVALATPAMTDFEWMAPHSRIIALDNLVTSLLATTTEHQLAVARDTAVFITRRVLATRGARSRSTRRRT